MTDPVVVTGAAGFVGRALLTACAHAGIQALGYSRSGSGHTTQIADYADTPAPRGAVLVHLAQNRDASAPADEKLVDTCCALARKHWAHVVYASSAIVYGDRHAHPRHPDEPPAAGSAYARIKLRCEAVFSAVGATSVRLANLYGPGMAENNVLADILRQIPGQGALRVRDVTPVRDFLWIEDAASCLLAACRAAPRRLLNAGSGRGISVGELAQLALDQAGESARTVVSEAPSPHPSTLVLDIAQTLALLDWSPMTDLRSGLGALVASART